MILGIGTDIINTERIARAHQRFGDKFLTRVFSADEIALAKSRPAHFHSTLAKRWAAKEATAKALGAGFRNGIQLKNIHVTQGAHGAPQIQLHGAAEARLSRLSGNKKTAIHVSLTDESSLAMAFVIIENAHA